MKIYIASSWKNQHGVEMLTAILREKGHEVISWIENGYSVGYYAHSDISLQDWINSENGDECFNFDIIGATTCDLMIYYGPSGKDACIEVGAAWGSGIPIYGLYAKGEDLGLMRKCISKWFGRYSLLLESIIELESF